MEAIVQALLSIAKSLSGSGGQRPGVIMAFGGATAPVGSLICDGSSVLRATYPALFTAIGTAWGSVDATHFTLPDLRGRGFVGYDVTQTEFNAIGKTGGEKTHLLTAAESGLPGHSHQESVASATGGATGITGTAGLNAGSTAIGQNTQSVAAANAASAHNNLQPYGTGNWIIWY